MFFLLLNDELKKEVIDQNEGEMNIKQQIK